MVVVPVLDVVVVVGVVLNDDVVEAVGTGVTVVLDTDGTVELTPPEKFGSGSTLTTNAATAAEASENMTTRFTGEGIFFILVARI